MIGPVTPSLQIATADTKYIYFDDRWTFEARKEAEFEFQSSVKTKLKCWYAEFSVCIYSFQSWHLQVYNFWRLILHFPAKETSCISYAVW